MSYSETKIIFKKIQLVLDVKSVWFFFTFQGLLLMSLHKRLTIPLSQFVFLAKNQINIIVSGLTKTL